MKRNELLTPFLYIASICILLIGCSPKYIGKSYDGPDLSKNAVATLVADNLNRFWNNQFILICKIDGKKVQVDSKTRSVDTLPGEHRVLFLYEAGQVKSAIEFTFSVQAGHNYLITFDKKTVMEAQLDNEYKLWVEDVHTGERLMNVKSSNQMSPYACF